MMDSKPIQGQQWGIFLTINREQHHKAIYKARPIYLKLGAL